MHLEYRAHVLQPEEKADKAGSNGRMKQKGKMEKRQKRLFHSKSGPFHFFCVSLQAYNRMGDG